MRFMFNPTQNGLMLIASGLRYGKTSQPTFALMNDGLRYVDGNVGWREFELTLDGQKLAVTRLSNGNWALAEPITTGNLKRTKWRAQLRQHELSSTDWSVL